MTNKGLLQAVQFTIVFLLKIEFYFVSAASAFGVTVTTVMHLILSKSSAGVLNPAERFMQNSDFYDQKKAKTVSTCIKF